jgi:hypothetical protein
METKKIFTSGLYAKPGNVDFIATKLSINIEQFTDWLKDNKQNGSDGYINIDIFKSKDPEKFYGALNTYKPREVKSSDHMPDRKLVENDGLPF